MCCCPEPNKNGEPGYCWNCDGNTGIRPLSPPALNDGDVLLFDEPGRCRPQVNGTGSIDFHSHHYRLVTASRDFVLLVRHGGGTERITIASSFMRVGELLAQLDSDGRYLLLHTLYSVHRDAHMKGGQEAANRFQQAFIDGRLKKRKSPGRPFVKVWIEPPAPRAAEVEP